MRFEASWTGEISAADSAGRAADRIPSGPDVKEREPSEVTEAVEQPAVMEGGSADQVVEGAGEASLQLEEDQLQPMDTTQSQSPTTGATKRSAETQLTPNRRLHWWIDEHWLGSSCGAHSLDDGPCSVVLVVFFLFEHNHASHCHNFTAFTAHAGSKLKHEALHDLAFDVVHSFQLVPLPFRMFELFETRADEAVSMVSSSLVWCGVLSL